MSLARKCLSFVAGETKFTAGIANLVIAGWTGRDQQAIRAHIEELAAIGIPRPKSTPIFYRASTELLTQHPEIEVVGNHSSGEAEPVIVNASGTLLLAVGSDHTDRKVETIGITLSKQMCAKPISSDAWLLNEVLPHWDQLILRSWATRDGKRRLYQEDRLAKLHQPDALMGRYGGPGYALPDGWAMFCGTVATRGEIAPADRLEVEIEDPVLGRSISHAYDAVTLPIEG